MPSHSDPTPEISTGYHDAGLSRRRFLKRAGLGALALALPSGLASTYWLSPERTTLKLPRWNAPGFRVAFLSDFHVDLEADVRLCQAAAEAAMGFEPNVILLGGDYLTLNPSKQLEMLQRALSPLKHAKCPVYGVLGNHDYWSQRQAHTIEALAQGGIRVLVNEDALVDGVRIIGLDDAMAGKPKYQWAKDEDKGTIALLHEPDLVDLLPEWASLLLSGHSHGGQICLPGGFPLMGPIGAERYITGYYPNARIPVYVTRGLGTRRVSVRYCCRPEATLLTLV